MKRPSTARDREAIYRGLWVAAGAVAVVFGLRQYMYFKGVVPNGAIGEGGDFYAYLIAARDIASGHSPYDLQLVHRGYGYAYSPFVALVFLPFRTLSMRLLWRTWISLSIVALVICCGLFTRYASPSLRRWHRPVFFAFVALTALDFGPTRWELYNGQTDTFVLLLLVVSSLVAERDRQVLSGALMGVGAIVKSWPGLVVLTLFRRRLVGRGRAVVGFVSAALVALVLVVIVGGTSGLAKFLRVTLEGSSQPDPSYSVWGTPKVLFSASRLAKPLIVSGVLRDVSTLASGHCRREPALPCIALV